MAPTTSLTITAKTGPAQQVTTQVMADVIAINYKFATQTIEVFRASIPNPEIFDLTGVTTVTTTVSGGNYTVTIS